MANAKLTALTELTAPTSDDLVYLVDDPSGTPLSRKVTLANLFANVLGATALTAPLRVRNQNDAATVEVASFEGDRATMTDNDLAYLALKLSDNAGNQDMAAAIGWQMTTVANGATQDGDLILYALTNNTGSAFSGLTEMLRLDGSTGRIGMLTSTPRDSVGFGATVNIADGLEISRVGTPGQTSGLPNLVLSSAAAGPANISVGDEVGRLTFLGYIGGAYYNVGYLDMALQAGTYLGEWRFRTTTAAGTTGVGTLFMRATLVQINPSQNDMDTQISGDNVAALFYVDASTDRIGIGTASPGALLDVTGATPVLRVLGTTTTAANFYLGPTSSPGTANMLAQIAFFGTSSDDVASIAVYTDGAADSANMRFHTQVAGGGQIEALRIDSAQAVKFTGGAASGQYMNVKTVTGTKTTNSGTGTETVSSIIPAGSMVVGVTIRVTTIVAGAGLTTYQVGYTGDLNAWGNTIALAANTTTTIADFTITGPLYFTAATNLVFTANAGQFDSGVIRYTIHYIDLTAATS